MHKRLDKIADRIAKTRFKTLPYTTTDDVYQAAYIGALVASRKPEFKPDDPGSDRWLYLYALQQVASQEIPLNKATSRCPRSVLDRVDLGGLRTGKDGGVGRRVLCSDNPCSWLPTVRRRIMEKAADDIDRIILHAKLDTDLTLPEIGEAVGLDHEDVYKRFKKIRLWARRQDFMLETYQDLTGKPYATKSRNPRNPNQKHHPVGDSES